MRFLSGASSSLSRSSVSRQRLDSWSVMSVFEIFVCSTGNLNLIAFGTLENLMNIASSTGFRFFRCFSVWRLWLTCV